MAQLTFKWAQRPSYDARDFIVSPANEEALHFLAHWPDGKACAALLTGPEASGKTHLSQSWATRTHAVTIDALALGHTDSAALWGSAGHAVLEDIHTITDETALFHLLRHAETQGLFLLLTARTGASQLPFTLADLRSRLLALPSCGIHAPDEALLKGFLFKCFADRQLRVGEDVVEYLLRRTERSFSAVHALVDKVEAHALEGRREITVPFVRSLLAQ